MHPILAACKAAYPIFKPVILEVTKKACVGVLGSLAAKYAYRVTGDHILAQRDRDIRLAAKQEMELQKVIADNQRAMAADSDASVTRLIAEENGYTTNK